MESRLALGGLPRAGSGTFVSDMTAEHPNSPFTKQELFSAVVLARPYRLHSGPREKVHTC